MVVVVNGIRGDDSTCMVDADRGEVGAEVVNRNFKWPEGKGE